MKHIIVGATGASGMPVLVKCLEILRESGEVRTGLIVSASAALTIEQELAISLQELQQLADTVYGIQDIGAGPASGSFATDGMLIVPCSMKTLAGIHAGYAENLLLRAADVTLKEQRPLVLGVRESPLSAIHLRNMHDLSLLPSVHITPLMLSFYQRPQSIDDMVLHMAATLLKPLGVKARGYQRWKGR